MLFISTRILGVLKNCKTKNMVNKQNPIPLDDIAKEIVKQPLDGLLYDLGLLPEQVKEKSLNHIRMLVIKHLYEELIKVKN